MSKEKMDSPCAYTFKGRLGVVLSLSSRDKFSLNLGSKDVNFGRNVINLDLVAHVRPDIVADARRLPLKSEVFEQVFFTDVIEHLPNGHEKMVLREIRRVLRGAGTLILSTPHNHAFYAVLDPAKYLMIHKHFRRNEVEQLLKRSGFKVLDMFTSGGEWAFINNLWYSFLTYPLKKFLPMPLSYAPSFMKRLEDEQYNDRRVNGYTIFSKSIKMD
jgi:SAM-dependent methyltransferase